MRFTKEEIDRLADRLNGTADSVDAAVQELFPGRSWGEADPDDGTALDGSVFECESCGWWFETGEMSEEAEWTCRDCCL